MKSGTSRPESDEKKLDKRKHRSRPTPKWLLEKQELDEIAKRRCLMVLEVLSGAKPVTDVIEGGQMSRGTYYKLEERALEAMLRALSPTAGPDGTDAALGRARRCGQPLRRRCGPARAVPDATMVNKAIELVRNMHGLMGADSLGRSTGLSRRQAAAVKQAEQTAMEREREAACTRVTITTPGIVRGFDQMYVWTQDGWRFPLVSADAAVPYRTSIVVAETYDEEGVFDALRQDLAAGGAPLVLRRDRHRSHRTDNVVRLLEGHGVLVLLGPPHYPRFYGQLERQNRDHRAWLDRVGVLPAAALQPECDRMRVAVNERWRRRALGWQTPAEAWALRPCIGRELRDSFRAEVYDRAARIERHMDHDNDLAMRLAIEQALTQRGYLRLEWGVGAN